MVADKQQDGYSLSVNEMKQTKAHYAWWILIGCCLLQGGTVGVIMNCCGVFFIPVCADLEIETADLILYRTIEGIVSVFTLPLGSRLLRKCDARIVLTTAMLIYGGAAMAMGTFDSLYQWYLAGFVQGTVSGLIALVAGPVILSNWFHKKTGFAMGIATASSGIAGAVFNYVISTVIKNYGWRIGYLVNGGTAILIVIPATLFLLRYQPNELGLQAYGAGDDRAEPLKKDNHAGVLPGAIGRFIMVICIAMLISATANFGLHLNAFGLSVGLSLLDASLLGTSCMFGNCGGKLVLGLLNDRIGTKYSALLSYLLPMIGVALLLLPQRGTMYIGAFLFGISMPANATVTPLLTRSIIGEQKFERAYPKVTISLTICSSVMLMIYGKMYDTTGNYRSAMCLCLLLLGAAIVLLAAAYYSVGKARRSKIQT